MVKSGGFATYGINYENLGREAGKQALAILKGEKTAANTPVVKLDAKNCTLAINLRVAEKCAAPPVAKLPSTVKSAMSNKRKVI